MGEAVGAVLLEESIFSPQQGYGKALYLLNGDGKVRELELFPSSSLDGLIPYPLLNPLQTLFYHLYEGGNALVCSPTSSGKSLIAYLFMKKHKGRLVYTAPTKSLVGEKVLEFRRYYGKDVEMRTGESLFSSYRDVRAKVVVSTYEHLAYAFRNGARWVKDIGALVVDEVHQISRRWVIEEIVTTSLDRGIPLLCLSATLPGFEELGSWIRAKLVINSHWRPVPLIRKVHALKSFSPGTKAEDRESLIASKLLSAVFSLRGREEKVLVFVPKKSLGWRLLEIASKERIGIMNKTLPFEEEKRMEPEIAFHNADVPKEEREEIERAFRGGNLNILVATQTLAYGVNLPADRAVVLVKFFRDREELKSIPDSLDVLQMEGRVGRLGIRDVGYSDLLVYGAREEQLNRELSSALQKPFTTALVSEKDPTDAISFLLLLGHAYEGSDYRRYIEKTYSFRKVRERQLRRVESLLEKGGYIEGGMITDKGLFCLRSGIPPTRFEEFLRRKGLSLSKMACIRPLLHLKKFDSLYYFLERTEDFKDDKNLIRGMLLPCGEPCLWDNTDQFLFYVEGLTLKYPNLKNPPGEFSYLGTDALHLLRNLVDMDRQGFYPMNREDMLQIAHSVKYGIPPEYATLGGVKGIGHIRANLLRMVLEKCSLKPPKVGEPTEKLLDTMSTEAWELLYEKLRLLRRLSEEMAREELQRIKKVLSNNRRGYLVDDKILLAFGLFLMGERALRLKKAELLEELLWSSQDL
ncbi:MAG: DEAD/DEAH box helicase [Acidobacteria bacterium]|jgi:helicase|nr:MAG: DEAD/DEAH box helicase [Acidobacteriota bacterium]